MKSDGSTAEYYELPPRATELQHLISHRDMNAQVGEIFRTCWRYGMADHSDRLRDAKKMRFYANAEVERLEALMIRKAEPKQMELELDSPKSDNPFRGLDDVRAPGMYLTPRESRILRETLYATGVVQQPTTND